MQPYGALTLFFRWRKKSVQKKASGTATPGKRLLLPILTAGLAMSRAAWLVSLRLPSCALGARLFPPSKWAGLFPSAAYRRSAPPQLAVSRLTPCGLKWFLWLGGLAAPRNEGFCSPAVGGRHTQPLQGFCFRRSRRWAGLSPAGWDGFLMVGRLREVGDWRVRRARAMRPVAEWRSALAKRQGAAPDRRAVAPVVPRR